MPRSKSQRARAAKQARVIQAAAQATAQAKPQLTDNQDALTNIATEVPLLLPPKLSDDPDGRPSPVRCGVEYPHLPVEWLWHKRIPIGKVTLLCGDPGLGKSLIALDIAARVTSGKAFPELNGNQPPALPGVLGEPANDAFAIRLDIPHSANVDSSSTTANPRQSRGLPAANIPASVLVLTNEDNISDTVRPRFEAAGGDLRRIFFAEDITNLREDFEQLEEVLDRLPSCRLIIIDPINSFVGPSDSHFATVVGRVLKPLAKLAEERGIAILAVTHLRKSDGATIQRAAGTMGFVGFARTVWTIARDVQQPHRRIVVPAKNNLAATDNALAYTIDVNDELDVPFVEWESKPLDEAAVAVATARKKPGPEAEDRDAAAEWLTIALAKANRNARELIDEGKDLGFHVRTLRRALKAIGGQTTTLGPIFGWDWSLPKPAPSSPSHHAPTPDPTPRNESPSPLPTPNPNSPSEPRHANSSSPAPPQGPAVAASQTTKHNPEPPTYSSSPNPFAASDGTPKQPVPFNTTCPLSENTSISTPSVRTQPAPKQAAATIATPPPNAACTFDSSSIDDQQLDASMQFLDECRARRHKFGSDPPVAAIMPTKPSRHALNGHPLIGQIAALAQREQAQPTERAPASTGEEIEEMAS